MTCDAMVANSHPLDARTSVNVFNWYAHTPLVPYDEVLAIGDAEAIANSGLAATNQVELCAWVGDVPIAVKVARVGEMILYLDILSDREISYAVRRYVLDSLIPRLIVGTWMGPWVYPGGVRDWSFDDDMLGMFPPPRDGEGNDELVVMQVFGDRVQVDVDAMTGSIDGIGFKIVPYELADGGFASYVSLDSALPDEGRDGSLLKAAMQMLTDTCHRIPPFDGQIEVVEHEG